MNFKQYILFFCLLSTFHSLAQDNIHTNYYYRNFNFLNPAAGLKDSSKNHQVQVYGNYKFIETTPLWKSYPMLMGSYHGKFGKGHSLVNAYYSYDNFSFYSRHQVKLGYGYNFIIKEKHQLRIAVRANLGFFLLRKEKISHIPTDNLKDLYFLQDLDFGIQYYWKGLFVGASGVNLIGNTVKIENEDFLRNQRGFYLNAGYDFVVKENYTISPYTLISFEKNFLFDLGLMVNFFKYAEVGFQFNLLEFRNTYLISGYIADMVRIGASFNHSFIHGDQNLDFFVAFHF